MVFGPGDDYQLVPDQTPVESLQQAAKDLSIAGQCVYMLGCVCLCVRVCMRCVCVFMWVCVCKEREYE